MGSPGRPRGRTFVHGTDYDYAHGRCRRVACRIAASRRAQLRRERRAARLRRDSSLVEHGTLNAYDNYCCRCDDCRAVKSVDTANRAERVRRTRTHTQVVTA